MSRITEPLISDAPLAMIINLPNVAVEIIFIPHFSTCPPKYSPVQTGR